MAHSVGHPAHTHALEAVDACMDAYKLCIQTAAYAANEGGAFGTPAVLQALYDAADAVLATSQFIARSSGFHKDVARLTVRVARHATDTLAPHTHDDGQLRAAHAALGRAARALDELTGNAESAHYDRHDEAVAETFPGSDTVPPPTEL